MVLPININIFQVLGIDPKEAKDYFIKINKGDNKGEHPLLELLYAKEHDRICSYINTHKIAGSKKAFFDMKDRKYVIQLLQYDKDKWVFYGIFGSKYRDFDIIPSPFSNGTYIYNFDRLHQYDELSGRLIFHFERGQGPTTGHLKADETSYQNPKNLLLNKPTYKMFDLVEMLEERNTLGFPGYDNVDLSWSQLHNLFVNKPSDWKTALSNVQAIYLQTDRSTGMHYVGSSYGTDGLWGRWGAYATNYHGGNKSLKDLYNNNGPGAFIQNFHYHILEIFPKNTASADIIQRETWWKMLFDSNKHGYNNN